MKIAVIMVATLAFGGCNKPSSMPSPQSVQQTEPAPRDQRHIGLPPADMTKELREHCGTASQDLHAIEQSVRDRDRMDDAETTKLRSQLADLRKQMDRCMAMVHGMEEEHLGEPGQTGPKSH